MRAKDRPAAEAPAREYLRQSPTKFIHALARTRLPGEATRMMAYLYDRANPYKPIAIVTLQRAAKEMGIDERTVLRSLQALEAAGRTVSKVLQRGRRIILVKPLPSPDAIAPDDFASQVEKAWNELEEELRTTTTTLTVLSAKIAKRQSQRGDLRTESLTSITHLNHPH